MVNRLQNHHPTTRTHMLSLITKAALIPACVAFFTFAAVFPSAIISFLKFYDILIPDSQVRIPAQFVSGHRMFQEYRYTLIDTSYLFERLKNSQIYSWTLELDYYCNKENNKNYRNVAADIVITNNAEIGKKSFKDEPYIVKRPNLQLASKDDPFFHVTRVFAAKCYHTPDDRAGYSKWVPPFLRPLLPPILYTNSKQDEASNQLSLVVSDGFRFGGNLYRDLKGSVTYFEVGDDIVIVEDSVSIVFDVQWHGIRYYLYHYKVVCFVVGVLLFWVLSSITCILVSLVVWFMFCK